MVTLMSHLGDGDPALMVRTPCEAWEGVKPMDTKITFAELDGESVALLPSKETLAFNFNWSNIYASNSSGNNDIYISTR